MSDPLFSCFYKLYRARQHLNSLNQEIAVFLHPDSYEIVHEFDFEGEIMTGPTRGTYRRRVVFKEEPPLLLWGIIIGDIIQNLRASLDHVVFAISGSRNPAEFRDDYSTEFPIRRNPDAFNRPRKKGGPTHYEIRGLPPSAKAIIEGLQPYHRGKDNLSCDPLWILREMSNIDKHRNIHVVAWSAHTIALDIKHIEPGVLIHSHRVRPPGIIESGAPLVEIDLTTPGPHKPVMHVQKEYYFTVAFGEGTPLAGKQIQVALFDLGLYVEGVMEALSDFIAV